MVVRICALHVNCMVLHLIPFVILTEGGLGIAVRSVFIWVTSNNLELHENLSCLPQN